MSTVCSLHLGLWFAGFCTGRHCRALVNLYLGLPSATSHLGTSTVCWGQCLNFLRCPWCFPAVASCCVVSKSRQVQLYEACQVPLEASFATISAACLGAPCASDLTGESHCGSAVLCCAYSS
jgi:hypothetical protein